MNMRREFDLPLVAEAIAIVIANRNVLPDKSKEEFWRAVQEVEPNYPGDVFERHWAQSGRR